MRTKLTVFDGVCLRIPGDNFTWPHPTFSGFPSCCGPGQGLGNKLVPESILGVRLSPACFIHDEMFASEKKSWANFYYSNAVFMANCMEINRVKSKTRFRAWLRKPAIWTYVKAVNTGIGAKCFFKGEIAQEIE